MNREEKKKMLNEFCKFISNKGDYTEAINDYLDSLEMNKEKAIEVLEIWFGSLNLAIAEDNEVKAMKFAIDYMKDEGEIIGWVNYYPESISGNFGNLYYTKEDAETSINSARGRCIQIPIRKPKI